MTGRKLISGNFILNHFS